MSSFSVRTNKGMSLVEILIGVGLLGVVAIMSTNLLTMGKKLEAQTLKELDKNVEVSVFKENFNVKNLDWRSFFPDESFYQTGTNNLRKVEWTLGSNDVSSTKEDLAIAYGNSKLFYRTSHSTESWIVGSTNKRVVFSRCVPTDTDEYRISADDAYNLNFVPIAKLENEKRTRVYCCPKNQMNCSSNQITNVNSKFKVRSFRLSSNKLTVFPKESDEYLAGLGFFQFFNKSKEPDLLTIVPIVIVDRCKNKKIGSKSKCNSSYLIKTEVLKASALGVQDRGYIQVQ